MPSLTTPQFDSPAVNHYQHRDEFIEQLSPIAVSVLYFGGSATQPQDAALYRQALYKLSFLYRHFLQPAGLRIQVRRQVATLSGTVRHPAIVTLGEILAHQIEGITAVQNEVALPSGKARHPETEREGVQELLSATAQGSPATTTLMDDESLQALVLGRLKLTEATQSLSLQAKAVRGVIQLSGKVPTSTLKQEAEMIAQATLGVRDLRSTVSSA